jgi:hypothetical protein
MGCRDSVSAATGIPMIQGSFNLATSNPVDWLGVVAVPFVIVFWLEISKAIVGVSPKSHNFLIFSLAIL